MVCHYLAIFAAHWSNGIEDITFNTSCELKRTHDWKIIWRHGKEILIVCQHPATFVDHKRCGWGVFNFSRDLTWPRDLRAIWLYGMEPIKLSHYPAIFHDHKHCGRGDIMNYMVFTLIYFPGTEFFWNLREGGLSFRGVCIS